jgi:hypothetical protein
MPSEAPEAAVPEQKAPEAVPPPAKYVVVVVGAQDVGKEALVDLLAGRNGRTWTDDSSTMEVSFVHARLLTSTPFPRADLAIIVTKEVPDRLSPRMQLCFYKGAVARKAPGAPIIVVHNGAGGAPGTDFQVDLAAEAPATRLAILYSIMDKLKPDIWDNTSMLYQVD